MAILIGCERVSHEWPGKPVLDDQTIGIDEGDRIGIVGTNGDGKSTLLELVAHRLEPDSGSVTWLSAITVQPSWRESACRPMETFRTWRDTSSSLRALTIWT